MIPAGSRAAANSRAMAVVGTIGRSAVGHPGIASISIVGTRSTAVIDRVGIAWRSRQQVETNIQVSAIRHLAANGPAGVTGVAVCIALAIDMLIVLAPGR